MLTSVEEWCCFNCHSARAGAANTQSLNMLGEERSSTSVCISMLVVKCLSFYSVNVDDQSTVVGALTSF